MDTECSTVRFESICRRYGWRRDRIDAARARFEWENYVTHLSKSAGSTTDIGGLVIGAWLRFGNAVTQISNAIEICKNAGISRIYYTCENEILDLAAASGVEGIFFSKILPEEIEGLPFHTISSAFYDVEGFEVDRNKTLTIFDNYIKKMLPVELRDSAPLPERTLVAHFRSGDIFGELIHQDYGQPPVAYYDLAVEIMKPREVLVICYDFTNPTTAHFINHCVKKNITVKVQCSSLKEDIKALLSAQTLVASRGTFCWALARLSDKLEHYWYFDNEYTFCELESAKLSRPNLYIYETIDAGHEFMKHVLSSNWANTPAQIELMATYPRENLMVLATDRPTGGSAAERIRNVKADQASNVSPDCGLVQLERLILEAEIYGNAKDAATTNLGCRSYGEHIIHTLEDDLESAVSWIVDASIAGEFHLWAQYASCANRPVELIVNGERLSNSSLSGVTDGWTDEFLQWRYVKSVRLELGSNEIRFRRIGAFPHLSAFALTRILPAPFRINDSDRDEARQPASAKSRGLISAILSLGRRPR